MEVSNDRLSRPVNPDDLEIGDIITELVTVDETDYDGDMGFMGMFGPSKKVHRPLDISEVMGISFPFIAVKVMRSHKVSVIDTRGRNLVVMTPSLINAINSVPPGNTGQLRSITDHLE